jgi:hypothetical protein
MQLCVVFVFSINEGQSSSRFWQEWACVRNRWNLVDSVRLQECTQQYYVHTKSWKAHDHWKRLSRKASKVSPVFLSSLWRQWYYIWGCWNSGQSRSSVVVIFHAGALQLGKGSEKCKDKPLNLALQHWLEAVRHSFPCALYINVAWMLCDFFTLVANCLENTLELVSYSYISSFLLCSEALVRLITCR